VTTHYARFVVPGTDVVQWGRVEGLGTPDARLVPVVGPIPGPLTPTEKPSVPLADVQLLAPVTPSKVVGIGTNYRAHAAEMGRAIPPVPKVFLKPATAVIGPGQAIEVPPVTTRVDHEAELAVVIGKKATRVSKADALQHVFGFTVCNDITARDFQRTDGTFARGKGFDTFCPLGPWVTVGLDFANVAVQGRVNGTLRQDGHTSDLIFDVPTLVSFVSHVMTLLPGDVISTGTPFGVGPLVAGDRVVVSVEGIGSLENPVVDRADRKAPSA